MYAHFVLGEPQAISSAPTAPAPQQAPMQPLCRTSCTGRTFTITINVNEDTLVLLLFLVLVVLVFR